MKLQQLRYLREVARQGCNLTLAAQVLHTSQPGISKQLRLLEEELDISLFQRSGKHLLGLTEVGQQILSHAGHILGEVDNIRLVAQEYGQQTRGRLVLATTHTQSRYVLPPVISHFLQSYPEVALQMQQGSPEQIARQAADGQVDFAIATEALAVGSELVMIPCFHWNRVVLVPHGHPLARRASEAVLSLEDLAAHPIVTYVSGLTGRSRLDEAFQKAGLQPHIVFTAADADVIKTYVRLGLGIGIVASMAVEEERDRDLQVLPVNHLFASSTTSVGFRRGMYLRGFMLDFLAMLAPHLQADLVRRAAACTTEAELQQVMQGMSLETR